MHRYIDTHTHLYDDAFASDIDAVIQRAQQAGVAQMYMPNCNADTIAGMMTLQQKWPSICLPMIGLHPCYVNENYQQELNQMLNAMQHHSFIAIGEIGLDYYWDKTFATQQQDAFRQQILWANERQLPIVIHSRSATADCIALVQQHKSSALKGVFHCFSGTKEEAEQIVSMGFYLGIGGVVTYKKTNLPDIIAQVGIANIILETDAPYLSPVPYRGKRNESSYLPLVAEKIAEVLQLSVEEIANITTQNALTLFHTTPTQAS